MAHGDKKLDWEISQRKGWKIVPDTMEREGLWQLLDPNGKVQETLSTEDSEGFIMYPGWSSNLRLGFELLSEMEAGEGKEFYVEMTYWDSWRGSDHLIVNASHWLTWHDGDRDMTYGEFVVKYFPQDVGLEGPNIT